jgi:DNA-binding transcriptional regulator YiaG
MSLIEQVRSSRLPPPAVARAIRRTARVTQQQLADELERHVVTIARWEAGTRAPRGEVRERYAAILDALRLEVEGGVE